MAGMGDVKVAEARAEYGENDAAVELGDSCRRIERRVGRPNAEVQGGSAAHLRSRYRDGYRHRGRVWHVYDIEGTFVTTEELPLETSWFDPIDLIGGFGGKTVMKMMSRRAATTAIKVVIKGASAATVNLLRRALAKLVSGSALKFTATTAAHMATKGRSFQSRSCSSQSSTARVWPIRRR